MWFIPEPPYVTRKNPLAYFADGMLGRHEYFKWPQALYPQELHSIAAPANPALLTLPQEMEKYGAGPHTEPLTVPPFKGRFRDMQLPWIDPGKQDFAITSQGSNGTLGTVSVDMSDRLNAVMKETESLALRLASRLVHKDTEDFVDLPLYVRALRTDGYLFQRSRLGELQRCHHRLSYFPMKYYDLILWFREFQRLLLDVRGWIIWIADVRPRLVDPDFDQPFPILPVRGVFTSDAEVAQKLFRVGIPVWLVREMETFTTATWINKVKTVIEPGICFSSTPHPDMVDFTNGPGTSFMSVKDVRRAMRRLSLLQHPMLRQASEYDPRLASTETTSAGPGTISTISAIPTPMHQSESYDTFDYHDGKCVDQSLDVYIF